MGLSVDSISALWDASPLVAAPYNAAAEPSAAPAGQDSADKAEFSPEALQKAGMGKAGARQGAAEKGSRAKDPAAAQEDPKVRQVVMEMQQRDREVRAHEQAHIAAGGSLVRGGASFGYRTGPDGQQYAVSGEVSIDMSPVDGDPRATIRKMDQVRKAAMAPAQPSGQDRAVASSAVNAQVNAQRELSQEQMQQKGGAQQGGDQGTASQPVSPAGKPGPEGQTVPSNPAGPTAPSTASQGKSAPEQPGLAAVSKSASRQAGLTGVSLLSASR